MRQDAMTSEKAMLPRHPRTVAARCGALFVLVAMFAGCDTPPKLDQPGVLNSPYPGPKLWAVAPLNNESGTTLVDTVVLSDKIAQAMQEVRGIDVVPVNRVLAAMSKLEMSGVQSVADARQLMTALGTDGLFVGTLSAWDPYEPPKIGATIQLIARQAPIADGNVDSRELTYQATGDRPGVTTVHRQPVAQASGYYDAANHQVIGDLHTYAIGRTPLQSPSGWRRYLLSMDLYSEFVSYMLTRELLEHEWHRLHAVPPGPTAQGN